MMMEEKMNFKVCSTKNAWKATCSSSSVLLQFPLLFNNPQASLSELCLQEYEILPCEPLHDVGHHIENVFTKLLAHLKDQESKVIKESLELCLENKYSKRTADYRSALVKTTGYLLEHQIMSDKPLAIICSLVEMQRILYAPDSQRSPSLILRYCNQSWLLPFC